MIHLFNKTEYSPFLQLSELNTQLSQTNQLKYAASAQPTKKNTAFTQLIRRSEKKTQHFYSFNAGLKKTQLLRSFFKKAAEKPAFTQLLRRAAFNFGKGILPRAIGSPTDFTDSLLRTVGQPMIFGTPLVVRQQIKYSLSTA